MNKKDSADTTQEAGFGAVEKSSRGKDWKRPFFFFVPFWHSSGQFCQNSLVLTSPHQPETNEESLQDLANFGVHWPPRGFPKKEFSKSRGIGSAPEHAAAREGRADRSWQNVFQTCLDFVVCSCLTILNITAGATKWCQHNNSYILQPAGITHIHSSKDGGARAATNNNNKKKKTQRLFCIHLSRPSQTACTPAWLEMPRKSHWDYYPTRAAAIYQSAHWHFGQTTFV